MSGIKDLGRVTGEKGDKGDTYEPSVTSQNGLVTIDWKLNGETKQTTTIQIPYYVPVKENGQLKFIKATSSDNNYTVASFSIADELKGAPGAIRIEPVDSLPSDENADPNTLYILKSTQAVYGYDEDGKPNKNWIPLGNSNGIHFLFGLPSQAVYGYDEDGKPNKKWIPLENPIKFDDYILETVANDRFTTIQNSIETRIGQILEQQYIISELLGDITIIDD